MMRISTGLMALVCVAGLSLGSTAALADGHETAEEATVMPQEPNLVEVKDPKLAVVHVSPEADWNHYTKVMFVPIGIEYRRGNTRMYRLKDKDKRKLGEEFIAAMSTHLMADGAYEIVTEPGPGVMLMGVGLTDVWLIFTKDTATGRGGVYGEYAIQMTLVTEAIDGETGEVLLRAADGQGQRVHNFARRVTSVDAWKEIRRAFDLWASTFRAGLDRAKAGGQIELGDPVANP